jgi:hypothetical protein
MRHSLLKHSAFTALVLASCVDIVSGFLLSPLPRLVASSSISAREVGPLFLSSRSSSSSSNDGRPRSSRIEGNSRQPNAEEIKVMDEMITKLANAKPYDLPNAVCPLCDRDGLAVSGDKAELTK